MQGGIGDFQSISTVTVGAGGQASISFTSIPSTYKHLQIRYIARSTSAQTFAGGLQIQYNGDTSSSYRSHRLVGRADGVVYSDSSSGTSVTVGLIAGGSGLANQFVPGVIDILDYASTNKTKVSRSLSGNEGQSTTTDNDMHYISTLYNSTNAITQILLQPSSNNIAQYSTFALYGIK